MCLGLAATRAVHQRRPFSLRLCHRSYPSRFRQRFALHFQGGRAETRRRPVPPPGVTRRFSDSVGALFGTLSEDTPDECVAPVVRAAGRRHTPLRGEGKPARTEPPRFRLSAEGHWDIRDSSPRGASVAIRIQSRSSHTCLETSHLCVAIAQLSGG
jgi:hypothetical protein